MIDELTVALQIREDRLKLRERAVRAWEDAVAERERRLPPEGDEHRGGPGRLTRTSTRSNSPSINMIQSRDSSSGDRV